MLPAIRRDPTGVFLRAARRYGDVAYFKIGPRRGYLITNPADVRHVLQDNARNYHKSPLYQKLRMSIGNGLLTRRRLLEEAAEHRAARVPPPARRFADRRDGAGGARDRRPVEIDGGRADIRWTRRRDDAADHHGGRGACSAGGRGPGPHGHDREAWMIINQRIAESFWSLVFAARFSNRRRRAASKPRATCFGMPLTTASASAGGIRLGSADLLAMLMAARDEETGEAMTDEQLRVEVTTFLLAGQADDVAGADVDVVSAVTTRRCAAATRRGSRHRTQRTSA